ncbi:MAG: hypothetical protein NC923_03485 [Candidatus Omnitrophica bacterium]|nr:hypothetical protein [Candidatus Omnitrophota bacterium]
MRRSEPVIPERRKYLRLDTVFPVQFRLLDSDARSFASDWIQGFTNNLGRGGICLCINKLRSDIAEKMRQQQAKLSLAIELPISRKEVNALAKIAWIEEDRLQPGRYLVGVSYEQIESAQNAMLMRYAWTRKLFAPVIFSCLVILFILVAVNISVNFRLTLENRELVRKLVSVARESRAIKENIREMGQQRQKLEQALAGLQAYIRRVEEEKSRILSKTKQEKAWEVKRIQELNGRIKKLTREKSTLQERLTMLQRQEGLANEELLRLDKKKAVLEKANFDRMYQWLKVHQNPRTGLVGSFEGDRNIAGWAFIYDQSLIAQTYIYFGDFARSRKIFDFFTGRAKRQNLFFFNAYYANDGEPAEYIVHAGPNIWMGIAICQYTNKTKDYSYIVLAEEIGQAVMALQNQDAEAGIRGGPDVKWYSTEHNLDAYAFLGMLYKLTGKKEYSQAAQKVLHWLLQHTYDRTDIPIKRGRGDATIATDTYAWSIAAVGPQKLESIGMSPDRIMEFAEENCSVTVDFQRPEGQLIRVKGFDFAPQRHSGRGGVVSCEWTAQMVIAFKIMSQYYAHKGIPAKAKQYAAKADGYLSELASMVISSASASGQGEGCLPYASQEYVDTGHGWITPKGSSTGSVAATAYTLFAYYNYNPLELKD